MVLSTGADLETKKCVIKVENSYFSLILHTSVRTTPKKKKLARILTNYFPLPVISGTFAVVSMMVGGVAVREVPDEMISVDYNSTNVTDVLEYYSARDTKRVQVAVALAFLSGLIQVCAHSLL